MKLKISLIIIFIILFINNVSGELINGSFDGFSNEHSEYNTHSPWSNSDQRFLDIKFGDISNMYEWQYTYIYVPDSSFQTLPPKSNDADMINFSDGGNVIAHILFGYYETSSGYMFYLNTQHPDAWINFSGLSGAKTYLIESNDLTGYLIDYEEIGSPGATQIMLGRSPYIFSNIEYDTYYNIDFHNDYSYEKQGLQKYFKLYRDIGNKSKLKIIDDGSNTIVNQYSESWSNKDEDYDIYYIDEINNTWDVYVKDVSDNEYYVNIPFSVGDILPTLTTDKTTYNTSEQITISYTNLNYIDNYLDLRSIIIMYPDINEYTGYSKKYIYNLLYHEYASSFTINTSFLLPQTDYILFACDAYDSILFEGNNFNVYPDNEYLSISCDKDAGCISYNACDITIYYKINNNSDIIIKDNDNNIINTYHNIIDTGSIIYTIPDDIEHLNIYPNWKIYLNNTDYATSYNKNLEVYWSLFESPTSTPTPYPTDTPDINISDQLDNLTVEIQPLKELLYGFVYIVIDNPDYDKDDIIDENEINHWFNSLIPMCLFLLLVILYIGLKKNRD